MAATRRYQCVRRSRSEVPPRWLPPRLASGERQSPGVHASGVPPVSPRRRLPAPRAGLRQQVGQPRDLLPTRLAVGRAGKRDTMVRRGAGSPDLAATTVVTRADARPLALTRHRDAIAERDRAGMPTCATGTSQCGHYGQRYQVVNLRCRARRVTPMVARSTAALGRSHVVSDLHPPSAGSCGAFRRRTNPYPSQPSRGIRMTVAQHAALPHDHVRMRWAAPPGRGPHHQAWSTLPAPTDAQGPTTTRAPASRCSERHCGVDQVSGGAPRRGWDRRGARVWAMWCGTTSVGLPDTGAAATQAPAWRRHPLRVLLRNQEHQILPGGLLRVGHFGDARRKACTTSVASRAQTRSPRDHTGLIYRLLASSACREVDAAEAPPSCRAPWRSRGPQATSAIAASIFLIVPDSCGHTSHPRLLGLRIASNCFCIFRTLRALAGLAGLSRCF
jgi:hypothetical protein